MTIKILDKKAPDALIVPLLQDDSLAGHLAEIAAWVGLDASVLQRDFSAEPKEVFVLYTSGSPLRRFYLLGVGKKNGFAELPLPKVGAASL